MHQTAVQIRAPGPHGGVRSSWCGRASPVVAPAGHGACEPRVVGSSQVNLQLSCLTSSQSFPSRFALHSVPSWRDSRRVSTEGQLPSPGFPLAELRSRRTNTCSTTRSADRNWRPLDRCFRDTQGRPHCALFPYPFWPQEKHHRCAWQILPGMYDLTEHDMTMWRL